MKALGIVKRYFQLEQISQCKTLLPTYDVFDEDRNLKPAKEEEITPVSIVISERRLKLGLEICEDLWDQDYDVKLRIC